MLNLVLCDIIESCLVSKNLSGLLNHTIRSSSYSFNGQMERKNSRKCVKKRLKSVCNTRWWSKVKTLGIFFSSYVEQKNEIYSIVLIVLYTIYNSEESDRKISSETKHQTLC